jgi:hypothetical protein
MSIGIPTDDEGRLARECKAADCSPGYFKVMPGTGIVEGQEIAYCPYCRHSDRPRDFVTQEQVRYAKDMAIEEAKQGVNQMLAKALGLGTSGRRSMGGGLVNLEISMKTLPRRPVRRPYEEDVRRDVVCPHCSLDHSVYGLATWCPDCGEDIFLTHVATELSVIRSMVADVPRRREQLGIRAAAKDLENSLEDTVSICEATVRHQVRRHMVASGKASDDIDKFFKRVGNAFQNVDRTEQILREHFNVDAFSSLALEEKQLLEETFAKRHLITHNLGVIDRKYLENARNAQEEGREVLVNESDIPSAIELLTRVFADIHKHLFRDGGA